MNRLLADYVNRTTHSDYEGFDEIQWSGELLPTKFYPPLQPRRRFSKVAKYLVLAGVVAALLWVVCNVVVTQ